MQLCRFELCSREAIKMGSLSSKCYSSHVLLNVLAVRTASFKAAAGELSQAGDERFANLTCLI